jgi:fructoselysine transporter
LNTIYNTKLERGLGLREATALNMIDMIGIGPFIVLPIVIKEMNGPQCMLAWVIGAVLSIMDGAVWSELGAAMPAAGGSYVFLKEIYGPKSWGKLFSFLLIWQTIFQAPLVIASGSIGFAQYLTFLFPLNVVGQKIVSGLVVITIVLLLYRKIQTIGKISVFLWIGVIATILWLIFGGVTHFNPKFAFDFPKNAFNLSFIFFVALGSASVQTIYTYLGYYNITNLGSELKDPEKNIPKSIFISIAGIALLYLAMQLSVLGVIPWREAMNSQFIVSTFVEKIYGSKAAIIATTLILWIAFSSLFSATLGYSRIPYAASLDGAFFKIFSHTHPKKHFPDVSIIILGAIAFIFSLLFKLKEVIEAVLAFRILIQFIGQAAGLLILRKKKTSSFFPFKMWLYPLPALIAIFMWLGLFLSTGMFFAIGGILVMVIGIVIFFIRSYLEKEWPFEIKI